MSIRHVVTLGFGFADGVSFIPTLGYTPGEAAVSEVPRFHDGRQALRSGVSERVALRTPDSDTVRLGGNG